MQLACTGLPLGKICMADLRQRPGDKQFLGDFALQLTQRSTQTTVLKQRWKGGSLPETGSFLAIRLQW